MSKPRRRQGREKHLAFLGSASGSLVVIMAITITVNGTARELEADGNLPLIFALRNMLGLKGVRFGCGGEDCGACTVMVDGELCFSCTTSLDAVAGRHVETVDGMDGAKAATSAILPSKRDIATPTPFCVLGLDREKTISTSFFQNP